MTSSYRPYLALDSAGDTILCDRPQDGCVVGKFIYARDNRGNSRKEKTMSNFITNREMRAYVGKRVARLLGRDAAVDDETAGKLKEFLKTKLSPGDHAQVCDMLEAAGGEPEADAEDDLPENAIEGGPLKRSVAADAMADFLRRFPDAARTKIDNSGIQPRGHASSYSTADAASFAAMFPSLAKVKVL
jgi:hypothetical protein